MSESLGDYAQRSEELAELRRANVTLQRQLRAAKDRTARVIETVYDAARDAVLALGPVAPVPPPEKDKRRHSPEVALWHLTDWQMAKVTPSYNSEIARQRALRFCQKAAKITTIQRADHPVKECVIAFGGDMLEGLWNFPTQPYEIDATLFGQFIAVARLEVDVIRFALSVYDHVTVVAEWGNHGRLGNKHAVVPKSDNADRMSYELARQQLIQEHRLTWDPQHGAEDIQRIEIGNYRALLIHGDEVGRSGFASPMTIVRHADRWKSGAYGWDFRDLLMGHYHTHAEWPMANGQGSVYQTGSLESENRYARDTMAASAEPSQRLHFIDPERGRVTSSWKIYVRE